MLVKDRMSSNPITAAPDTTHRQANDVMREHNIHHLPVVDRRGNLIGIVSDEDLIAAQPSAATTLSIYEIHNLLSKLQLKDLMQSPVITIPSETPIEEAARLMQERDISCLPVVDNEQLVGIITDSDLFTTMADMLGSGQEGARFTLQVPDEPGMLAKVTQAVTDAGGNILSLVTWKCDDGLGHITIKERGADYRQLKQALDDIEFTVDDLQQDPSYTEQQSGRFDVRTLRDQM
ncbi:MAG: CBS domain-containing protein [Chloroflexi bacterium]|nr:CBS domain-containing protein [Chloroflexota bacterium]